MAIDRPAEPTEIQSETQLMLEAARLLSSSLELKQVLEALADITLKATGISRAFVNLIDMDRLLLTPVVATGGLAAPGWGPVELNRLSRISLEAILARRTTVLDFDADDVSDYDRSIAASNQSHTVLFVPLLLGDRILGNISLDEPGRRRSFTEREIELVQGIASQAAVVVRNAQLFEAEQQRARLAEALTEIDRQLHSSADMEQMVQRAVALGGEALHADTGAVTRYDPHDRTFTVEHAVGFPDDPTGLVFAEDTERHSLIAIQTREPVLIQDSETDPRVDKEHLAEFGVRAVVVVPLVLGGEEFGNLNYNFSAKRYFDEREIDFIGRLGASVSLAMENARLLDTERASARINEALARIDQSIHSTLEQDVIFGRVAVESATAIGADSTVLALREGDLWVVRYASNMPDELMGQGFTVEQAPFMLIAAETGQPVAIDDAYNDPRTVRETQEYLNTKAVMVTPIVVRDEVIGGLFFNYWEPHEFSAMDIRYARRLAASVGLALANVRLYQAEHDIADRLQSALLSLPEEIEGLEFAHAYHSATEAARVGGDFYDVFEMAHGRIGIVIGDVAGKGLDAAVLTSLAKHTIRAHAMEPNKTPRSILQLANEVVLKATPADVFVTIFFGVLDLSDGRFVYANAGHMPAIVACTDGPVEELDATGPLLGAFGHAQFSEAETTIRTGDSLVLYTDGLTEARSGPQSYGVPRLIATVENRSADEPRVLLGEIIDNVITYSGNQLKDDLAVLVVRRD